MATTIRCTISSSKTGPPSNSSLAYWFDILILIFLLFLYQLSLTEIWSVVYVVIGAAAENHLHVSPSKNHNMPLVVPIVLKIAQAGDFPIRGVQI